MSLSYRNLFLLTRDAAPSPTPAAIVKGFVVDILALASRYSSLNLIPLRNSFPLVSPAFDGA